MLGALGRRGASRAGFLRMGLRKWKLEEKKLLSSCLPLGNARGYPAIRAFTTKNDATERAEEEEPRQDLVLTPGEKVVAGTRLMLWTGILAFAGICAYYIGKELFPTKMSPNHVFDKAFAVLRERQEVVKLLGGPLKAYGRDHGGHREGRRNFIEHTEYKDETDGSKRTRVRFNLEGQFGTAFVFAEVSSQMKSGEFVYLLVQDKRTGRVLTVIDNRSALVAKRLAGDNEGVSAITNLLNRDNKS